MTEDGRMAKILVCEDDRDLNAFASSHLVKCGYQVDCAFDGEEAFNMLLSDEYSLLLSDIMMPGMSGFELAGRLRERGNNIPIIFMTARDDKASQMFGYELGIDDYIVKPFDIDVLALKISALLRRARIDDERLIEIGNFNMRLEERVAMLDGNELALTRREFDILYKMLSYPKKTFTRSAIMQDFWDIDSDATPRTVDVYMAKLREKTKGANGFEIATVHGIGYKVVLK